MVLCFTRLGDFISFLECECVREGEKMASVYVFVCVYVRHNYRWVR